MKIFFKPLIAISLGLLFLFFLFHSLSSFCLADDCSCPAPPAACWSDCWSYGGSDCYCFCDNGVSNTTCGCGKCSGGDGDGDTCQDKGWECCSASEGCNNHHGARDVDCDWGNGERCCGSCGGCFVEGTEVATKELKDGETEKLKNIAELEPGEIVSSFNPETGEISESQVAEVHKLTREGYFELETESGKKVKVTGEHPFLAIKANNFQFPISNFQLIDKLKNVLSNTLTFRLITGLQAKLVEILD